MSFSEFYRHQKKIKKVLAFFVKVVYSITCRQERNVNTKTIWSVGQAAKTSPSHGENRGSIPLQTATVYIYKQPNPKELVILRVTSYFFALLMK